MSEQPKGMSKPEWKISIVDVADGEFMLRKLEGNPTTVRQVELEFGLREHALAVYRANHYSRRRKRRQK